MGVLGCGIVVYNALATTHALGGLTLPVLGGEGPPYPESYRRRGLRGVTEAAALARWR